MILVIANMGIAHQGPRPDPGRFPVPAVRLRAGQAGFKPVWPCLRTAPWA